MKTYVGYIRVSTAKQGEHGVSLQEQKDAISRYAERQGLQISQWFEERETAAKRGRPIFNDMLSLLRRGKADGVMIHKIDRSARNMKDWAELGEMIDQGIEVHFVNESLDLASRGGRLSADIQAVVAADFIRNLRQETRKGFYGRIKQGFYPLPAPIGYLDRGKAKPKEPDPVRAPLVRRAFEMYATASWTLARLRDEISRSGLRSRRGGEVSLMALSDMLRNPFYIGLIRLKTTREIFPGAHVALVSNSLFERVQLVLQGKSLAKVQAHDFQFRRLFRCKFCGYGMAGELQKGHVYYRCHTSSCPTASVREEVVDSAVLEQLEPLSFDETESVAVMQQVQALSKDFVSQWEAEASVFQLQLGQLKERLERLTDAYIDRLIDCETFEARKQSLLREEKALLERKSQPKEAVINRLSKFFELAGSAYFLYKTMFPDEKRLLLRNVSSNRSVAAKRVEITLKVPFQEVANRRFLANGTPHRDRLRTLDALVRKLAVWFVENPGESFDIDSIRSGKDTISDEDAKSRDLSR